MRATVTRLMSKGISSRGMPVSGDVTFSTDSAGRKILALNSVEKSEIPVIATLLHPQMASMAARSFTMHGYELVGNQLFGQAWEIEPVRR